MMVTIKETMANLAAGRLRAFRRLSTAAAIAPGRSAPSPRHLQWPRPRPSSGLASANEAADRNKRIFPPRRLHGGCSVASLCSLARQAAPARAQEPWPSSLLFSIGKVLRLHFAVPMQFLLCSQYDREIGGRKRQGEGSSLHTALSVLVGQPAILFARWHEMGMRRGMQCMPEGVISPLR